MMTAMRACTEYGCQPLPVSMRRMTRGTVCSSRGTCAGSSWVCCSSGIARGVGDGVDGRGGGGGVSAGGGDSALGGVPGTAVDGVETAGSDGVETAAASGSEKTPRRSMPRRDAVNAFAMSLRVGRPRLAGAEWKRCTMSRRWNTSGCVNTRSIRTSFHVCTAAAPAWSSLRSLIPYRSAVASWARMFVMVRCSATVVRMPASLGVRWPMIHQRSLSPPVLSSYALKAAMSMPLILSLRTQARRFWTSPSKPMSCAMVCSGTCHEQLRSSASACACSSG